jgi:hypothetical protein
MAARMERGEEEMTVTGCRESERKGVIFPLRLECN